MQCFKAVFFQAKFFCASNGHMPLEVFNAEICRFLGIVISMYFDEHNPPHFHVSYNEHKAILAIKTLNVIGGSLPARVRGLVEEWAELHQDELITMWESHEFHKIAPLV